MQPKPYQLQASIDKSVVICQRPHAFTKASIAICISTDRVGLVVGDREGFNVVGDRDGANDTLGADDMLGAREDEGNIVLSERHELDPDIQYGFSKYQFDGTASKV